MYIERNYIASVSINLDLGHIYGVSKDLVLLFDELYKFLIKFAPHRQTGWLKYIVLQSEFQMHHIVVSLIR